MKKPQKPLRNIRDGSRAAATFKMECFVIIVNGFQPLTIIWKHSILDVAAALDPPLNIAHQQGTKKGFAICELGTIFEKLSIEITSLQENS